MSEDAGSEQPTVHRVDVAGARGVLIGDGSTAAIQTGAERLVSEDLQDGRRFGALTMQNPFREPA